MIPLRALPRVFVPGADPSEPIPLPKSEVDKLRKVLRLSAGAEIVVLPNDGTAVRCVFANHEAQPVEVVSPQSESKTRLTVAQSLAKGDKLDEIVRACTEIGVAHFVLFSSERTVVRWDQSKLEDRINRLEVIATEACEVSFRTILPTFVYLPNLEQVLSALPTALVLSEAEGEQKRLGPDTEAVIVGPEGGWTPRELKLIGNRGVTLGPRVLRVDHAAPSAAAMLLLERGW